MSEYDLTPPGLSLVIAVVLLALLIAALAGAGLDHFLFLAVK